jgi:hypothetical protein
MVSEGQSLREDESHREVGMEEMGTDSEAKESHREGGRQGSSSCIEQLTLASDAESATEMEAEGVLKHRHVI